jgi:putative glutamine amidotransferase
MHDVLLDTTFDLHHTPCSEAIAAAGGLPVQLPREGEPRELVRRLDAIVISGGDDVDPRRYGALPGPHTTNVDPDRDSFEVALVDASLELDVPLLAICRGCQLLNVARGGTLVEHVPLDGGEEHQEFAPELDARVHGLHVPSDELLASILPADVLVNSFHHQAIDKPGVGVAPVAFASDGICEAIRVGRRSLGVQWHPEFHREQPDPVFLWLVAEARKPKNFAAGV